MGDYAAARPHLERPGDPQGKSSARNPILPGRSRAFGNLLRDMADYAAARSTWSRPGDLQGSLRRQAPDTATSLSNLGVLLNAMEDYAAARSLRHALAIRKEVLGDKHPYTAHRSITWRLAQGMGDYAAARPCSNRPWRSAGRSSAKAPHTALSFGNPVRARGGSGRWKERPRIWIVETDCMSARGRVLPSLSAREQATFLTRNDERSLMGCYTLGLLARADPRWSPCHRLAP